MNTVPDPRTRIRNLMADNDRDALLRRAGEIHGHYCPFLGFGVNAACTGLAHLGVLDSTGMEEIMAVVDCNSCFVDGIQAVSGCTFGNNAIIYRDLGKTAVIFYRRGDDTGIRLSVNRDAVRHPTEKDREDAEHLFTRAVRERQPLTDDESKRFRHLWQQASFLAVQLPPEEAFTISEVDVPAVPYAPIFDSVTCSICGESIMETRACISDGNPACRACADAEYWILAGRGIHPAHG